MCIKFMHVSSTVSSIIACCTIKLTCMLHRTTRHRPAALQHLCISGTFVELISSNACLHININNDRLSNMHSKLEPFTFRHGFINLCFWKWRTVSTVDNNCNLDFAKNLCYHPLLQIWFFFIKLHEYKFYCQNHWVVCFFQAQWQTLWAIWTLTNKRWLCVAVYM